MCPATSTRTLVPTSIAVVCPESTAAGRAETLHTEHGQARAAMCTMTPADGRPRLPLSSMARGRIVAVVTATVGVHAYDHDVSPAAGCHVTPLSTVTSTPPTTPPPVSLAVPEIVTSLSIVTVEPPAGAPTCALGAT